MARKLQIFPQNQDGKMRSRLPLAPLTESVPHGKDLDRETAEACAPIRGKETATVPETMRLADQSIGSWAMSVDL
jgi:hypothetical protein